MKHLIVLAHPNAKSFTHTLAEAYVAELAKMGHGCDFRDLYAMNFNPVLQPSELNAQALADAQAEQERVKEADATAFFYPCGGRRCLPSSRAISTAFSPTASPIGSRATSCAAC
jgi:putative NADPH-quinone reductase